MRKVLDDTLGRHFDGILVRPGDPGFDAARSVWNVDIDRRPALVARPAAPEAVAVAIAHARHHGLPVAIRGGGHGLAGHGTADGALVIDLSGLDGLEVDARSRTVTTGGGLRWGPVDAAAQEHGLAVTGADAPQVGVAGTALGGGFGWLHRLYGLTCDNLVEAEVVTADGATHRVDAGSEPELFWALRGGGGNFGVVTRMRFALHPLRELTGGVLIHPIERGAQVLRHYQEVADAAPGRLAVRLTLMAAPPAPFVPEPVRGRPIVMVGVAAFAPPDEAERMLRPLREFGPPVADAVRPMTYLQLQQPPNRFPERQRAHGASHFLGRLDDAAVDGLLAAAADAPGRLAMLQIQQLGGAIAETAPEDTPFGFRDAAHLVAVNALAERDDTAADLAAWSAKASAAIRPHATGGPYVNFVSADEPATYVPGAFAPDAYARLTAVKKAYDPDNLFRFNANIAPSAPPSAPRPQE
ncbi:FAD-binding oxidoreductase [Actinomadura nitritigenes]|uniref:FAD-binding oxidoreductase n=1 Tax=Actinomadura nitritigenes TaxID=134602 RepID=A0ABS3QUE2_9ACTN|nr:FAD-binding oxidoreductase [Actinomadura nitritigenes]MBO2437606.1 FAD-binding oxidoreductase [Actinomadura nitritigenes]